MISSKEELVLMKDRLFENYNKLTDCYNKLRKCCDFINGDRYFYCLKPKEDKMPLAKRIVIYNVEKLAKSASQKHKKSEDLIEKAKILGDDEVILGIISLQQLLDENDILGQLDDLGEFGRIMDDLLDEKVLDFKFKSLAEFEFFKRFANALSTVVLSQKDTYDCIFDYLYCKYPKGKEEIELQD